MVIVVFFTQGGSFRKNTQLPASQDTTLVVTISKAGNEPFTFLCFYDSSGFVYEISADSSIMNSLNKLQGRTVVVSGTIIPSPVRYKFQVHTYKSTPE